MKIVHVELLNCFLLCKHNQISSKISCRTYKYRGLYRVSVDKTKYCQYCTDAVTTVKLYIFFTNNAIELMVNLFSP